MVEARYLSQDLGAPIEFIGWQKDASSVYNTSQIFVSTSLWEGLPLGLIEAAAAGTAIVATDVAGNRDVAARGVPMTLVPAEDDHAIAVGVGDLLTDHDLRVDLGRRASAAAEEFFDIERMGRETLGVYEAISKRFYR